MRAAPLLAAATAALLLTGCAPAATTAGGIYADPVPPTASAAPHVAAGAEDASDAQQTAGTDETAAVPSNDLVSCVQGDWDIPNSTVLMGVKEAMLANPQSAGMSPQVDIQGGQWARLGPSSLSTTFDNLVIHITLTTQGRQLDEFATLSGTTTQTYTVVGDVMTVGATDVGGLTVTMTFQLDGQPFEFPGSAETAEQMRTMLGSSGGAVQVACTPTTMRQVPIVNGQGVPEMASELARR